MNLNPRWNVEEGMDYCSEAVKIIFSAIHSYICEVGERAFMWQGHDVTSHVVEIVR